MSNLIVTKLNEVFIKVTCETCIARELSENFSFYAPGYRFMPAFKMRMWDGKIRLFNTANNTLYVGLLPKLKEFCEANEYTIEFDKTFNQFENYNFSEQDCTTFLKTLNLTLSARDYQLSAIAHSIRNNRALLLSPTGSGKSFIIYALTRFHNKKTLIVVPTVSLVHQMLSDFKAYAVKDDTIDVESDYHCIFSGQEKDTNSKYVISTWQSIFKMPKSWFEQFEVVIGDECHLFKAKSLISIMEKLVNAKYRIGTTGTLDDSQTNKLTLEGLFGDTFSVTTTKELMDNKHLSKLSIDCIILKYPEDICKFAKDANYQDEIKFLIQNPKRNAFIRNLALTTKTNCLVLFQLVDLHGKVLYKLIQDKIKSDNLNRKVFFVSGEVDAKVRENIRQIVETEKDAIIVASSGTFSTGINIRNLENIIFASPTKSRIKTLQSIGRTLRIGDTSDKAKLYDIVDDLTHKKHKNFAVKHFLERVKIYDEQQFEYKIHRITIKQ
ncbi:MAG: DEAD/DEAH box helicase family protein [Bacteroidota bacterium]|jgi:superfamily II DNA or RNA helicase